MKKDKTLAKGKKFIEEFKAFINRGNVVDMAVGVVIGAAFGKIVTGFVNLILNPFIGLFIHDGGLDGLKTVITPADEAAGTAEVAILWGSWIQTIVDFLIVAFVIFLMIKLLTRMTNTVNAKKLAEKAAADAKAAEEAKLAAEEAAKEAEAKAAAEKARLEKQEALLSEIRDLLAKK